MNHKLTTHFIFLILMLSYLLSFIYISDNYIIRLIDS